MAAGYSCQVDDECVNPVSQLVTSLVNGATVASCREHLPVFLVGALAAEIGLDADRLYDAIRRFEGRERDRIAKAAHAAAEAAQAEADRDDLGDDTGVDASDAVWGEPTAAMLQEANHDRP